jgi:hypothetical protein
MAFTIMVFRSAFLATRVTGAPAGQGVTARYEKVQRRAPVEALFADRVRAEKVAAKFASHIARSGPCTKTSWSRKECEVNQVIKKMGCWQMEDKAHRDDPLASVHRLGRDECDAH